jgi:O-antigen/teichoic acid export membrane protein
VLSLAVPLAVASDRVVLSHVSSARQVADYGVCLQIFAPVMALIAAAGAPLWPIYVAAKSKGTVGPRVARTTGLFVAGTIAVCAVLVPLSGPIGDIVGDGKVDLGTLLPVSAALMTVAYALAYPIGMVLTSPSELRFMAVMNSIALPLNLVASIILGHALGAPGPMLASTGLGIGLCLVGVWYLRTHPVLVGAAAPVDPALSL